METRGAGLRAGGTCSGDCRGLRCVSIRRRPLSADSCDYPDMGLLLAGRPYLEYAFRARLEGAAAADFVVLCRTGDALPRGGDEHGPAAPARTGRAAVSHGRARTNLAYLSGAGPLDSRGRSGCIGVHGDRDVRRQCDGESVRDPFQSRPEARELFRSAVLAALV